MGGGGTPPWKIPWKYFFFWKPSLTEESEPYHLPIEDSTVSGNVFSPEQSEAAPQESKLTSTKTFR